MEFTQEQKLYAQVVNKAWEDAEFKKSLMESPLEAIEKLTGQKVILPEGKKLIVRDQMDESTTFINIPAEPKEDLELSEEQLEAVAGGGPSLSIIIGPWIPIPNIPTIPTYPTDTIF